MGRENVITTGFELEMIEPSPDFNRLVTSRNFGRRTDASLRSDEGEKLPRTNPGIELVTPILSVSTNISSDGTYNPNLNNTVKVLGDLLNCAKKINSSCGFHLHLGRPNGEKTNWNPQRLSHTIGGPASEWKPSHVRTMLLIGLSLEKDIFEIVPESRKLQYRCQSLKKVYSTNDICAYYPLTNLVPRKYNNKQRYCWMNLIETRRPSDPLEERVGYARSSAYGTVEIRALGETLDLFYITAWLKLWIKIAAAVAYLPSEMAALKCIHGDWLKPEMDELKKHKKEHESSVAPKIRSILPAETPAYLETDQE